MKLDSARNNWYLPQLGLPELIKFVLNYFIVFNEKSITANYNPFFDDAMINHA